MFKICYHNLNLALTLIVVVLAPLKLCESAVCLCHYLRQLVRQLADSLLRFVGGLFHFKEYHIVKEIELPYYI